MAKIVYGLMFSCTVIVGMEDTRVLHRPGRTFEMTDMYKAEELEQTINEKK